MYFRAVVLILLLTFASASGQIAASDTSPDRAYDTVLVCPPDLQPAAAGWLDHRSRQGHKIAVISGAGSKAEIKNAIQSLHNDSKLKTIVIFGDAPRGAGKKLGTQVETHKRESAVIRKWGAEPTFATDSYYSDLNGDGVPDVAIGRITADTPGELASITNKIIAYEQNPDLGMWRRRVNFIAGVGGFGVLADKILESAAKKFITDGIPSEFQTSMTQASWRSPYSPHPGMFRAQTIERMNEGCLAWIYLGHGRKRELDYYRVPQGGLPIMSARDVQHVNVRQGAPIAVFLSCYTGAFDSDPDCMAEELLANPAGPVAVIAGANVTMPYAMTVLGNEMLRQMFEQRRETLGEVLLYGQRKLAEKNAAGKLGLIDQLAKVISPDPDLLDEERQEHSRLFHLIGDPLLRLRHPGRVTVEAAEYATSGQQLDVAGRVPFNGDCRVEFVCRRDRMTFKPPSRPKFQLDKDWLNGLQETYSKANDTVWDARRVQIQGGEFTAKLKIPADARGPAHVRVYIEGEDDFAMGATDVYVRPPPAELVPEPTESPDPQPAAVSPIN